MKAVDKVYQPKLFDYKALAWKARLTKRIKQAEADKEYTPTEIEASIDEAYQHLENRDRLLKQIAIKNEEMAIEEWEFYKKSHLLWISKDPN